VSTPGILFNFDRLDYGRAWGLQHRLVAARESAAIPDALILLEHDPVYTIGRSGRPVHWGGEDRRLLETGVPVFHIERGGSVTYHGPGQVIGYPILKLGPFCSGPKAYICMLEEILLRTLKDWQISGERRAKLPGVWVGQQKIAALGVRISRGITMHGFALNVTVDLTPFSIITPCGIPGCQLASMAGLLQGPVDPMAVRASLTRHFAEVFQLEWTHADQKISGTVDALAIHAR
jgi:lipoyl(octanoyl) transferase